MTQSETEDEPLTAATLAPESAVAHDSVMFEESTILVGRSDAAVNDDLRPADPAGAEAEGPFEIADIVA